MSVVFAEAVTEHGVLTSKEYIVMQWNISRLFIKTILDKELGKKKETNTGPESRFKTYDWLIYDTLKKKFFTLSTRWASSLLIKRSRIQIYEKKISWSIQEFGQMLFAYFLIT